MRLQSLPLVLQDLVTGFAWGKGAHETYLLASIAVEVNRWSIPDVFIRRHWFDWTEMCTAQSPLEVFNARIQPCDWFREDICFMLLQMLDFRRKPVKAYGNRMMWMRRLREDWTAIVPCSEFYSELLSNDSNWKSYGLRSFRSLCCLDEPDVFVLV